MKIEAKESTHWPRTSISENQKLHWFHLIVRGCMEIIDNSSAENYKSYAWGIHAIHSNQTTHTIKAIEKLLDIRKKKKKRIERS